MTKSEHTTPNDRPEDPHDRSDRFFCVVSNSQTVVRQSLGKLDLDSILPLSRFRGTRLECLSKLTPYLRQTYNIKHQCHPHSSLALSNRVHHEQFRLNGFCQIGTI